MVRDLEICPSKDFVNKKFIISDSRAAAPGIRLNVSGQIVSISAPGETVQIEVMDLRGRLIANLTYKNRVQWELPRSSGTLVVWVRAGHYKCRFVLPVVGRT